jgi:hypothetical protein
MDQRYGGRYEVRASVQAMPGGHLYEAEDLSLKRRVLVYALHERRSNEEMRAALLRAAGFTHDDFVHVLDVGMSLGSLYAVFKWVDGAPLVQELRRHRYAVDDMLAALHRLGQAMLEAAEDGMFGYSVLADNLWLGHGGRLLPVCYWEAATDDRAKGAVGLCNLLVQLCTKEMTLPEKPDAVEHRLRLALYELPPQRADAVVALVGRTFREKLALTAFLAELRRCLPQETAAGRHPFEPSAAAAAPVAAGAGYAVEEDGGADVFEEDGGADDVFEEDDGSAAAGRGRIWRRLALVAGAAGLFVIVFVVGLTLVFRLGSRADERGGPTPSLPPSASAEASTPASAKPSPAPSPAADDSPAKPPAGSGAGASGPTTVPKLVGLSRADAEKAALSAGLHYTFYLESSSEPQGTVFKQEPNAGEAAARGDSVTFWVSKGK